MRNPAYRNSEGYKALVELLGGDRLAVMITHQLFKVAIRTPRQLAGADYYDLKDARWIGPRSLERVMGARRKLKVKETGK